MLRTPTRFNGIESTPGRLELNERLVFLHFPKTAGTTIHDCLTPLFGSQEICPERHSGISSWPQSSIQAYRFFSAHAGLKDFRFVPAPLKVITFLRNPIIRSLSMFEFWASHKDEAIASQNLRAPRLAKYLGMEAFFSEENADQCGVYWNSYTLGLVGDPYFSPSGRLWQSLDEIIEHAIKILDSLAFVGISEDLATSFDRMCDQFDIPNYYDGRTINVTRSNHILNPGDFEALTELDVTPNALASIENTNKLDITLYNYAVDKFFGGQQIQWRFSCVNGGPNECIVRVGRSETWVQNLEGGFILFGPYVRLLPRRYKVEFRIRRPHASSVYYEDVSVGFADVVGKRGEVSIGRSDVRVDLLTSEVKLVTIEFELKTLLSDVEFRFFANPLVEFEVEKTVTVFLI